MREPYEVDIKDFEIKASDGLLKGVAYRLGHSYEYVRQRLRDSEKTSWYEQFFTFWLALDAESPTVADQYFYDFKARRDALRASKSETDDSELMALAVRSFAAGMDATIRKDVSAMKKEIPQLITAFEDILASAEMEVKEFPKRAS